MTKKAIDALISIGIDIGKDTFHLVGFDGDGQLVLRKKIKRMALEQTFEKLPRCIVGMEACLSAHFVSRSLRKLGFEPRIIPAIYVRPFIKRQKNDAADAEAIVIAARQPEMRFVEPKTLQQQSRAAIFRGRERLVHQRTADVNALRALLYEHGHVFPAGIRYLNRMEAVIENEASGLPALIREECLDLLVQIAEKTTRITERTKKLSKLATQSDHARCRASDRDRRGSVRT